MLLRRARLLPLLLIACLGLGAVGQEPAPAADEGDEVVKPQDFEVPADIEDAVAVVPKEMR